MLSNWQFKTVGDLFDIVAGKSVTPGSRQALETYPFLRTSNLLWGEIDLARVDRMYYSADEIKRKSLRPGDLLVCEGGDIGRSAIWSGEIQDCGFQNHIHCLRPKSEEIFPGFYMYYLQAGFTMLGIYEGAGNKTTIPNISKNTLSSLAVPVPSLEEQKKIFLILSQIQQLRKLEEKLIATTRELKQSAMQQLFTKGLRGEKQKETEIGLLPENWKISQIGSIAKILSGGTPSRKDKSYWEGGTIPWVKTGEVNYSIIKSTEEKITPLGLENSAAKILPCNTILIAMYGQGVTRGRAAILGIEAACNQACAALIPCREDISYHYLYYYINFSYEKLRSLSHGANQQNLNIELISSLYFPLPELQEQIKIVKILRLIDEKLSTHERKLNNLEDLFQTLLHQLMTGEIRVDDLDLDLTAITPAENVV